MRANTLSEGFVATAVVLAWRAGIDVEMPRLESSQTRGDGQHDVQVPGDPRTASAALVTALDTRAREMDRWMAR
ncbi:DUF6086 family protein [Streptomyces sp. NPDC002928]|uniref:DUF6086 family protein n=1 Tax=Streptomyces sp. NPDC002928 TaxID=3154440 RepID=UPI0033A09C8D